ncbi:cytochrome P450 [Pseudonocardia sulfidoxydans NBRC 16205]|uniref:Cytochrome P450 n=1 Tax=Pseudonocardia sulfidoxydans NBRC 16205 TaxID=1223511 RepID=A0A511DKK3_9PSEU|nr:cytochrome P450 [Pseudonocardia sulfidoxydans]GEL25349.1 cytochrome P450 [Pseudonocardia sulfidoxydans NBRC 16205]
MSAVEIDLSDPESSRDPATTYGAARERSAVARLVAPGMPPMWAITRYAEARALFTDPRFALTDATFALLPTLVDSEYLPYLRTMQQMEGPAHARLRRAVSPAFTPARAAAFRPQAEAIVDAALDRVEKGRVDLVEIARPLPIEIICALLGVPEDERGPWHQFGVAVATGHGQAFVEAVPRIIDAARAAVEAARARDGDDVLAVLARTPDGPTETETITLVWQLLLAGQVPALLVPNAVHALLTESAQHPDPATAVDELIRWCGPQLLSLPRIAQEDVEVDGVAIAKGDMVSASLVGANRDPRVFDDPDTLRLDRHNAGAHLGFAHGPHFCLGASLARMQTEVTLRAVLRRDPRLVAPDAAARRPDPGTWRLTTLPVELS